MNELLDEFAPTAALGALAFIAVPLMIVALPFWLLGLIVSRLLDRLA